MAKTISERGSPSFYFSKDTLYGIPISVLNGLKSEASSLECGGEILGVIDEKHGVFDVVFLTKLPEETAVWVLS